MTHLIDKDALIAEIERLKADALQKKSQCKRSGLERIMHQISAYNKVLSFINTLEVKEVNLEKEIDNYLQPLAEWEIHEAPFTSMENIAKHFFELGLSVNSPITAADRCTAEEIILALNTLGEEKMISYDKEIEWLNKLKKL